MAPYATIRLVGEWIKERKNELARTELALSVNLRQEGTIHRTIYGIIRSAFVKPPVDVVVVFMRLHHLLS
jgi:hypothetical protein